jgi:ribosomal protein S18 acetylase RimI-like enzyme
VIVVPAVEEDIPAWLDLAAEVETLFGVALTSDDGFLKALHRNVCRGTAMCVREDDDLPGAFLCGGLLYSPTHRPVYELSWLAVASRCRRHGIGHALVEGFLKTIEPPAEISLLTFCENAPDGAAARHLYESMGFLPGEMVFAAETNGAVRQRFRKRLPDSPMSKSTLL